MPSPSSSASIPATRNEAWGFCGTFERHAPDLNPATAWKVAMVAISEATGASLDEVRAFLDSRWGRHFADDVGSELCCAFPSIDIAVGTSVARWMAWSIDRSTSRDLGIPVGLPYLTGFVHHAAIEDGEG